MDALLGALLLVEAWRGIAARYAGRSEIWSFDLMNEPDDSGTSEDCLDWNGLALAAARAIREVDPGRTLIVECANVGSASAFSFLRPLPLEGVVYSFHIYAARVHPPGSVQPEPAGPLPRRDRWRPVGSRREWDGWSLEHGPDRNDHRPAAAPGPRLKTVQEAFRRNSR